MKLDRLPRVGETLKVDGKLLRITDIKKTIYRKESILKVDIISISEIPSRSITVQLEWAEQ